MNTPALLIDQLQTPSFRKNIDLLAEKIYNDQFDLTELLQLTTHSNKRTAFHAAWLLETLVLKYMAKFAVHICAFIKYGALIKCHSCQRHYVKIYKHLTSKKAAPGVIEIMGQTDLEPIVEQCFDWLINPGVKVAVKAFAAETLFNLSQRYQWIAEELANQLQHLMQNGSPAIQSTGRRLLKALQR